MKRAMKCNVVHLILRSYQGFGGSHWYGTMECDNKSKAVSKTIEDQNELYDLMKNGAFADYKVGGRTIRFLSCASVIQHAKMQWRENFPKCVLLLAGNPAVADPQEALDGKPELVEENNRYFSEACSFGGWDNKKKMTALCKRWDKFVKRAGIVL